MVRSMTGFGRAQATTRWGKLIVELRSINHRALEVICHFPQGFNILEIDFRKAIEKNIQRGRINCNLSFYPIPQERGVFNRKIAKAYFDELLRLKRFLNLKGEISLEQIISYPGVMAAQAPIDGAKVVFTKARALFYEAIGKLVRNKEQEGRAIYYTLNAYVSKIRKNLNKIKFQIPLVIKKKTSRLPDADEASLFIKEHDISEEIQRIGFHLKSFKNIIINKKRISIGKELDFIAQELQREGNTINTKSASYSISSLAIKMKADIEKIREQLQNIE